MPFILFSVFRKVANQTRPFSTSVTTKVPFPDAPKRHSKPQGGGQGGRVGVLGGVRGCCVRVPHLVLGVNVSARLDEVVDDARVAVVRGVVEGGLSVL